LGFEVSTLIPDSVASLDDSSYWYAVSGRYDWHGQVSRTCPQEEFMDITAIGRSMPVAAAPASVTPVDNSASNRDVVQAVKALNGTEMFGENELTFQKDPQTHRMVIKIVNRHTEEVVMQIPPEYVLQLAEDLKRNRG
jgi:flagellar protein FlaG